MDAIIVCAGSATPVLVKAGLANYYAFQCSDGSIPGTAPMGAVGLSDLAWSDASLLVSALLTACVLATCWNILGKMFHRG